jgi:hypothetical protein
MEGLDDHELKELERLLAKGRDVEVPEWKPEFDERERGPSEAAGIIAGRYIDDNCERWTHRAPGENEQTVLRTNFQMMARNFVARDLWASIYRGDIQTEIERAVKSALAFSN